MSNQHGSKQCSKHGAGGLAENFTSDPKARDTQRVIPCLAGTLKTLKPCPMTTPPTWLHFLILTKHWQ